MSRFTQRPDSVTEGVPLRPAYKREQSCGWVIAVRMMIPVAWKGVSVGLQGARQDDKLHNGNLLEPCKGEH